MTYSLFQPPSLRARILSTTSNSLRITCFPGTWSTSFSRLYFSSVSWVAFSFPWTTIFLKQTPYWLLLLQPSLNQAIAIDIQSCPWETYWCSGPQLGASFPPRGIWQRLKTPPLTAETWKSGCATRVYWAKARNVARQPVKRSAAHRPKHRRYGRWAPLCEKKQLTVMVLELIHNILQAFINAVLLRWILLGSRAPKLVGYVENYISPFA